MRILTYLRRLEAAGGVETHVLELSRELSRRGHVIDLCYAEEGNLSEIFASFCGSLTKIPSLEFDGPPLPYVRNTLAAVRRARHLRPDVVYVNHATELSWAVGVGTLCRAGVVCYFHTFVDYEPGSIGSRAVPLLGRRVSRFLADVEFVRDAWQSKTLKGVHIDVIPNGVALSDYPQATAAQRAHSREVLGLPADAYVVVYLGRIVPIKGVDVLLDAWRQLAAPPDEARLLIAGVPREPSEHDDYVRRLQDDAPPGSQWLPMQRGVVNMLHAADVLVLPSRWEEPFGRILIEALATGTPVVAAAVGGLPEVLTGEFARFLFPREDAASLAQQLHDLRNWREVDAGLGDRCIAYVNRRFSLQNTSSQMEAAFRSATAPHAAD